jgi:hypothetical protein
VATSDSIIIKNKKVKYVIDLVRELKDKKYNKMIIKEIDNTVIK